MLKAGKPDEISIGDELSKKLNKKIAMMKLKLPLLEGSPECGGGPREFKVKTVPANGVVEFLPKFLKLYCDKINIRFDEKNECDFWLPPVRANDTVMLGGVYFYFIRWKEGRTEIKQIDVDRFESDVVTLKRD